MKISRKDGAKVICLRKQNRRASVEDSGAAAKAKEIARMPEGRAEEVGLIIEQEEGEDKSKIMDLIREKMAPVEE